MRDSTHFNFNNISSEEFGVVSILEGSLYEQSIAPNRSIIETKIPNRDNPYHQRVELEPLSFSLTIFIEDWEKRDNLRQIAKWLYQPYYKPLTFYSNLNKVYYAMFEGDSTLFHNGMKQGYVTLNVRCSSPYSYSPPITVEATGNALYALNNGDVSIMPKMTIKKTVSDGNITITNTFNNKPLTIVNLKVDESIFIDNENGEIVSTLDNVYRYDDSNLNWISLEIGNNNFETDGDCEIEITYEEKYLY